VVDGNTDNCLVGITDYVKEPFDIEAEVLGPGVEIVPLNLETGQAVDPELLARLDALLAWHAPIDRMLISQLRKCQIVVRYGVGYDNCDLEALRDHVIPLCNSPTYGTEEVANTTVAFVLTFLRKLPEYDLSARLKDTNWERSPSLSVSRISECTVGLIGMGRIGKAVADRLRPFGCRIAFFDPYSTETPGSDDQCIQTSSLDELLKMSDVVSLHCMLTEETEGLVNETFIAAMKPGAILVNTARGKLIQNLDVALSE
jgi:phosphoglycerate dehydrogenase-like enzyme